MQETQVQSLDREDPLKKEMATHSSILDSKILWTDEPGGLQSTGSQRVRHKWACMHTITMVLKSRSRRQISRCQSAVLEGHNQHFWLWRLERWKKGSRFKEFGKPQSWKRQGNGLLDPPEYNTALLALWFSLWELNQTNLANQLNSDSWSTELQDKLCCF